MDKFVVRGGNRLAGTVRIGGAKNSILPVMAAVLLNKSGDEIILKNVPHISDVVKMVEILTSLGARITWSGDTMKQKW